MFRLRDEQIAKLLQGIKPSRVQERDNMSYVEAWDIRATMNRIFGFCGWSLIEVTPAVCVFERPRDVGRDKKPGFHVAYRAHLALVVHTEYGDATYAGSAVGDAVMGENSLGDAHDMALKSAESGALKRAATNLGDQFGLSLYNKTMNPVVQVVIGYRTVPAATDETGQNESATPVQPDPPPAATQGPPASAGGDPLPPAEAPTLELAVRPAYDALPAKRRPELARWAKDNGITNMFDPHLSDDKVQAILAHCELIQQGMA